MACRAQADLYVALDSRNALLQALEYGNQRNLEISVLGEGSNVICSSRVRGLVIQLCNKGRMLLERPPSESDRLTPDSDKSKNEVRVSVQAGENWHQFVSWTLQHKLRGLENLSLIPGSVGAAPIQNIGAYGVEVKTCLESVRAIHKSSLEERVFHNQDCQFGYRDSIFKHKAKDWIIWEVTFCLSSSASLNTEYAELNKAWQQIGSPDDAGLVSQLICKIRQQKLPDPRKIPNAGSFFKNPVVSRQQWQDLNRQFPEMVSYPQADGTCKLAAGWLIQYAGWKGFTKNGIGVCETQALVIVNPGRCSGREILALAKKIQQSVKAQFAVNLEIEPTVL